MTSTCELQTIQIELDEDTAVWTCEVLKREADLYTQDPTCTPKRILAIRSVIERLNSQINK